MNFHAELFFLEQQNDKNGCGGTSEKWLECGLTDKLNDVAKLGSRPVMKEKCSNLGNRTAFPPSVFGDISSPSSV